MTKYDKALQSGTKEYEAARKRDRPKPEVKREVREAAPAKRKADGSRFREKKER